MDLKDLVRRSRSYRRFDASVPVGEDTLRGLVGLAREAPSAANRQPLKYGLSCAPERNEMIFQTLRWAAYLKEWEGPKPGERPAAYIVIALDKKIAFNADVDAGIVAQTILLGAVEMGLGGCILANFQKKALEEAIGMPKDLSTLLVIALGKPAEKIVLEGLPGDGSIKYYRDESDVHHVPKRDVKDLIFTVYA